MIIIQVAGGLGNQMQQYAMYTKLKKCGKDVLLDLSWFDEQNQKRLLAPRTCELKLFPELPMELCSSAQRDEFLKSSVLRKALGKLLPGSGAIFTEQKMYHPEIFTFDHKYLCGFFLCQKYYDDIMPQLCELFRFPAHSNRQLQERNLDIMKEMDHTPSVSVHLRRGDYLTDPENQALFGNIATQAYYEAAMDYFLNRNPETHFYIFSNDTAYVHEHYADPARYTVVDWNNGRDSLLDMELMSHCQGNICANSTFSFWGARLNRRPDKEVIRTFVMRNNQPCDPEQMHDYWKGWILMDRDGKII
ncbi:MAG: alpha-1,2-fucosyltransferase [Butyrivibrio sp.]|jgi:hypothetical protein|nr:alpha-1,2-fucosyltransferase [Butyrivibrio sp.]